MSVRPSGGLQRDCRILEAELAERPDDPFVLYNLGATAAERRQWPIALGHLQRSLRGSAPTDSIVRKLFAQIARCHQMLGDFPAALNACSEGLRLDPDDAELHFRKAVLRRKAGEPAEAEACWRRILTLKRPDQFSASTRASTVISPCAASPCWPRNVLSGPRLGGSGGWF